ncbi:MAG: DUF2207 domain-containing protein, partial [bacterium]|nr:DUF2207 domain-containing protein [bacterium]
MKKLLIVLLLLPVIILVPKTAHADVNDFVINNFEAKYFLSNTDKQGLLQVTETIHLTFSDNNHGILRAIPNKYKGQDLNMQVDSVAYENSASVPYTTYDENDNRVIKIGDPDKTVTGKQSYIIQYKLSNVMSFYDGHDEFYWDINGDQWQQPMERVTVDLYSTAQNKTLPNKFGCFAGPQSAQAQPCSISAENFFEYISLDPGNSEPLRYDHIVHAETTESLGGRETLTIVAGYGKGYFVPSTWKDKIHENIGGLIALIGSPLLIGGYAINRWRKFGRDVKGKGTIVPQFDPPMDLKPAEVGTLADFALHTRELTATIIDFAIRGYIKIIEEKKVKKLAKDSLEYSIELVKNDFTELDEYELKLMRGIFGEGSNYQIGSVKNMADLKGKFYTSVQQAKSDITKQIVTKKLFKGNPLTAGGRLWVLFGFCIFLISIFGAFIGPLAIIGFSIAMLIVLICALAMPARTLEGSLAKEHALGLKLYLETAEKDRLKMMQSPNAPYANNTEPKKTVNLYEKLLPYAIVFGVEKQWSKQFKDIYSQSPQWYNGTSTTFNSIYLA